MPVQKWKAGNAFDSACAPDSLPSWQVRSLRTQLGYLFLTHALAAILMHVVVLEAAGMHQKIAWASAFLAAWTCGTLWIAVQAGRENVERNAAQALRMAALGIFLCSSPWVLTPILYPSESASSLAILACVLMLLAAMSSHALYMHFPSCALSLLCILLPPALSLTAAGPEADRRLLICLLAFLAGLMLLCLRVARGVSDSTRSRLSGDRIIDALEEELEMQRVAADRSRKALLVAEQECMEKTRFLATASHDLRQPIHAVSLFVAALKSESFESHTRYLVDRLDRALSGLDNLFNRLLDISRIDAGLVSPALASVDAAVIAQTMEYRFLPLAQSKSLAFRVRCKPGLRLRTDPELLIELLSNLLANAFRYTEKGGVLLTFRERNEQVLIQVWDSGCGIAEQHVELVFDEFVQLNNPSRDRRRGLGLGLAIVKRLAGAMGHELEVRSRVGSGSCFGVRVQRAPAVLANGQQMPDDLTCLELQGALVLVVDDEIDILAAMDALLTSWGCISVLARSVEEARKFVEDGARYPDLIITDHRLGNHHTCFDVGCAVSALIPYPVPMIVISGESSQALENEVTGAGWHFMRKPADARALHALAAGAVRQTADVLRQAA